MDEDIPGEIWAVAADSLVTSTLYVTADSTLYRSRDEGDHFEEIRLAEFAGRILAASTATPGTLYGGRERTFWRSRDGGSTWVSRLLDSSVHNIVGLFVAPELPETLYLCTSHGVFRSEDSGDSWHRSDEGIGSAYVASVATDTTGTVVLASTIPGAGPGLFRSTDGGQTWDESVPLYVSVAFSSGSPAVAYALGDILHRSEDYGASWTFGAPPLDYVNGERPTSFAVDPTDSERVYIGSRSGIYRTGDGGMTWVRLASLEVEGGVLAIALDPFVPWRFYVLTALDGVLKTEDAGSTWTPVNEGLEGTLSDAIVVDTSDPEVIYLLGSRPDEGRVLYRTVDAGRRWHRVLGPGVEVTRSLVPDPTRPGHVYATVRTNETGFGFRESVYRSTDFGASWQPFGSLSAEISVIAVASNGSRIYARDRRWRRLRLPHPSARFSDAARPTTRRPGGRAAIGTSGPGRRSRAVKLLASARPICGR